MAATGVAKLQLVIATGTIFTIFDSIKEAASEQESFFQLSATTLQGISAVMFTNSVIGWVVDSISTAGGALSPSSSMSASNIGFAVVSIVAGVVASKVVVSILQAKERIGSSKSA